MNSNGRPLACTLPLCQAVWLSEFLLRIFLLWVNFMRSIMLTYFWTEILIYSYGATFQSGSLSPTPNSAIVFSLAPSLASHRHGVRAVRQKWDYIRESALLGWFVSILVTYMTAQPLHMCFSSLCHLFLGPYESPLNCLIHIHLSPAGVVEFLSAGRVPAEHRDFKELGYAGSLRRMPGSDHEFTHNFKLASAYSEDIMPYTNYTSVPSS